MRYTDDLRMLGSSRRWAAVDAYNALAESVIGLVQGGGHAEDGAVAIGGRRRIRHARWVD
jgi:hypothetical protein